MTDATQVQVLALRVAADLIQFQAEEGLVLEIELPDEDLREAVWDTSMDQDTLNLDLFDELVFIQVVNEVRALLKRARESSAPTS
jgi:hypothetical protein